MLWDAGSLEKDYDASLRNFEDNYKDLDSKSQKLQKQIKETRITIGEIVYRHE